MTTPFPFQEECVREIEAFHGRALVALPPGLGKSLISLLYAKRNFTLRPVVIVCPASLKWNWANEIEKHKIGMSCEILEGRRAHTLTKKRDAWVVNYDILPYWLERLNEISPLLIVGDELHFIKSPRARRSRAFKRLCKGVPCVLGLSGTPLVNRPSELFNSLNVLRPDLYPNFFHFATEYCRLRRTRWGLDYSGAKNLGKLHKSLSKNLMIRRRREDVLKDLPLKSQNVVTLPIERRKEYALAVRDFVTWATRYAGMPRPEYRIQRMVQIGYIRRLVAELKLGYVMNWVDDFLEESDEKIILFARHKRIVGPLYQRYKKQGVLVDGSVSGRGRQEAFDKFTKDPKTRILVGNLVAAGTGWNGQAANHVAFAELPDTPGDLEQCSDRIYRIGQNKNCFVWHLIAHNTIEEDLCESLQRKAKILAHTLDGSKSQSNLDIYDLLEKSLRERPLS